MNNPNANAEAVAPPVDRGRGRGGRGRGSSNRGGIAQGPRQVAKPKIGPNRMLEVDISKDASLKDAFVVWMGGANGLPLQFTVHRPVGETPLAADSWVITPTSDIEYLLKRKSSEETTAWERRVQVRIREVVLQAGAHGRRVRANTLPPVEEWCIPDSPACAGEIRRLMEACKAASRPEGEWLSLASDNVRAQESAFRNELKSATRRTEAETFVGPRPPYETFGGAAGTTRQVAVQYLDGLTPGRAFDAVRNRVLGLAQFPAGVPPQANQNPAGVIGHQTVAGQGGVNPNLP